MFFLKNQDYLLGDKIFFVFFLFEKKIFDVREFFFNLIKINKMKLFFYFNNVVNFDVLPIERIFLLLWLITGSKPLIEKMSWYFHLGKYYFSFIISVYAVYILKVIYFFIEEVLQTIFNKKNNVTYLKQNYENEFKNLCFLLKDLSMFNNFRLSKTVFFYTLEGYTLLINIYFFSQILIAKFFYYNIIVNKFVL